jgi:hypothetical protein
MSTSQEHDVDHGGHVLIVGVRWVISPATCHLFSSPYPSPSREGFEDQSGSIREQVVRHRPLGTVVVAEEFGAGHVEHAPALEPDL